jgi:hypothetical protein
MTQLLNGFTQLAGRSALVYSDVAMDKTMHDIGGRVPYGHISACLVQLRLSALAFSCGKLAREAQTIRWPGNQ